MKLEQKQVDDILNELQPSIIETLKSEIASKVEWQVLNAVSDEIGKYSREWVKENVIPELEKELIENKKSLISLGVTLAENITETLAKELTETVNKKLSSGYDKARIMEALFK